jgi:hypothetical protein
MEHPERSDSCSLPRSVARWVPNPTCSVCDPVLKRAHNPKVGGSNPPPATTYNLVPGGYWLPFQLAADSTTSLGRQYAPHHHAVGGPLTLWHRFRIDVHRALNGRVPEQFLLDFDIGTHPTQQAGGGMPKCVPADSCRMPARSAAGLICRCSMLSCQRSLPARLANTKSDGVVSEKSIVVSQNLSHLLTPLTSATYKTSPNSAKDGVTMLQAPGHLEFFGSQSGA